MLVLPWYHELHPHYLRRLISLLKQNVLRPLPQNRIPKLLEILIPLCNSKEMIRRQAPHPTRKRNAAIAEQDLSLRESTRIEQYLAGAAVGSVVLETYAELLFAERDPEAFAAPADVYELLAVGKEFLEHCGCLWCIGLELGEELVGACCDQDLGWFSHIGNKGASS